MMMTKEEISKAIEDCEARIEECEMKLKRLREDLNKPEYNGKRWKPKRDEEYWSPIWGGQVMNYTWYDTLGDNNTLATGDVFPTPEAAKFEVERRKVITELSDFAESADTIWEGEQWHYRLCYNLKMNRIEYDCNKSYKCEGLYFSSEEVAKAAVEAVGADRVKKYYLGVKE